ncbi:MAG: hypothetical protein M1829_001843 [Trizodia sp. TS-e1964]|nr:MAG: hypothetical protein M1829_001843 [Trizodia sp. TS-e1964]
MAWRSNQGITGSNNIPLGRRRFGEEDSAALGDDGGYNPSQPSTGLSEVGYKRGRSPTRAEAVGDGIKKRKKRNRWGDADENKAAGLMGLPTMIKANMTNEQLEAYTLHLRIEEISQKLRINDVIPADGDRSPSPAPQYDNFGRRVNTREYRYRKRLEDERHKLIEKAMKVIPNYHPPSDYRRPTKTQEKVYVPVNDYPEINFSMIANPRLQNKTLSLFLFPHMFWQTAALRSWILTHSFLPPTEVGLLIGPRGNTLKKMEIESQAKIAIRGKGSVKEGKGRSDAAHTSNQEEDLHCLIMADTEEKAASIPEGQNELKRNQLRELAALNGTLRDDENQACQNCGQIGHRKYDCPEQRNFTANIICRLCGNSGHMARDCPDRQRGANWRNDDRTATAPSAVGSGQEDAHAREYEQLMQELSGGASIIASDAPQRIEAGSNGFDHENLNGAATTVDGDRVLKPWQRGPTGAAAPWQTRGQDQEDRERRNDYSNRDTSGTGSAPPWTTSGVNGNRGSDGFGGYNQQAGSYSGTFAAPAGGTAPWQQAPPPGSQQQYNVYKTYDGYGNNSGFPPQQNMGAPPGLDKSSPGGLGAPPGLGALFQTYNNQLGSPPPPPPVVIPPPPPPPSEAPPPPPPAL